jgi:prepilin-type N-terminal cleavage/methylation domain-containing protein
MNHRTHRTAFTLVELLVVITIIAILIALLLPAVQAAREAARSTQCRNHCRQLALGCLSHESLAGRFPCNGWGFCWTGDADRGNDWRQPGSWLYNILPYIEQQALHDMGLGLSPWNGADKKLANTQRMFIALEAFYCPSRRPAIPFPFGDTNEKWNADNSRLTTNVTPVGHCDYVGNGGDVETNGNDWHGDCGGIGQGGPASVELTESSPGQMTRNTQLTFSDVNRAANGIFFCGSMVKMSDVADGAACTYLFGEKYMNADYYLTGQEYWGDAGDVFQGDNQDSEIPAVLPPWPDTPGYSATWSQGRYGGAHVSGLHMAFCDGSVQFVNFAIEFTVHQRLANRKDGRPLDPRDYQ